MKNNSSAAVIIKARHQSSPKEHWADQEIRKAAEEIDAGHYVPEVTDEAEEMVDRMGIALGMGYGGVATGEKPTLEDFRETHDQNQLMRHPRVEEALERLKVELEAHGDSQEAVEMSWMLHEMVEKQSYDNRWKGQRRWEGKENEEMRQGRILSPQQFHAELCSAIGTSRVHLGRFAYKEQPEAESARVGLYVANPAWNGTSTVLEFAQVKAAELRKAAEKELVQAKRLRLAKQNALADTAFKLAMDMIQTATEIYMERDYRANDDANKEFLRVGILQWPLGTEWMLMRFNEFGVPTTARFTGWRTALLTMIRQGVITEVESEEAFPLDDSPAAQWFKEQLWLRRARGYGGAKTI